MNRRTDERDKFPIYLKNQMIPSYKVDERILKTILSRNIDSTSMDISLNLKVYYKNMRSSNLIMQNNPHTQSKQKSFNVCIAFRARTKTVHFVLEIIALDIPRLL